MSHEQPLPEPWQSFLSDLDHALPAPVELHCLGGFVLTVVHRVPRVTFDLDFISVIPRDQSEVLDEIAGQDSELAHKYKVNLQHVGVADYPDSYEERLIDLFPGKFSKLRLRALELHDLVLAKLTRANPKDAQDVKYLAEAGLLSPAVLMERYEKELRPYLAREKWHSQTLQIWIEDFFPH